MFSITVEDRIMIAHSLPGEVFGPAQGMHGATFVVEASLRRDGLNEFGIVADLGLAGTLLREVLAPLDYANLDELLELAGLITTTEVLARFVADRLADRIGGGALGTDGAALGGLVVRLRETPTASASYERAL